MGCATGTIKYALFIFNALWAILGILVIGLGGLGWGAMPQTHAISIIVLGCVMLFISFFGCFGALRESSRLLWTYATLLLVLLVLIVAQMFIGTRDVFKEYAIKTVEDSWVQELTTPGSMNLIQKTYNCCGRNGADDYVKIGRLPPSSCCKDSNCINPLNLFTTGCLTKVEDAFADEAQTRQYYEWGMLGFDLIILVLAVILAIHYTNRRRRYNY
ncbi:protein late bloomer [Scaptodrosophila lebanonensis]|uniref:Tetraspanin n=1 Tax=Drosophila lebanonensis TaxID=7225 RepID=A0A6J2UJR0_DROLE|nr:protein late bloomer [Scaptodrosophila lebanonensis]